MKRAPAKPLHAPARGGNEAKILHAVDFCGGEVIPDQVADFPTGIGITVYLCGGCSAKHLALSTVVNGMRRTVTLFDDDARELVRQIAAGMANS